MYVCLHALLRFLAAFQDNKHLGKDALKFAKTFNMGVKHEEKVKIGSREDMYTASYILTELGMPWAQWGSAQEALDAVKHLQTENARIHGYEKKMNLNEEFPMFSQFWYVFAEGKQKSTEQIIRKELSQDTDLKNVGQLEAAKLAFELHGFDDGAAELGDSSASVENAKAAEVKKLCELIKLSYLLNCIHVCHMCVGGGQGHFLIVYMYVICVWEVARATLGASS